MLYSLRKLNMSILNRKEYQICDDRVNEMINDYHCSPEIKTCENICMATYTFMEYIASLYGPIPTQSVFVPELSAAMVEWYTLSATLDNNMLNTVANVADKKYYVLEKLSRAAYKEKKVLENILSINATGA